MLLKLKRQLDSRCLESQSGACQTQRGTVGHNVALRRAPVRVRESPVSIFRPGAVDEFCQFEHRRRVLAIERRPEPAIGPDAASVLMEK